MIIILIHKLLIIIIKYQKKKKEHNIIYVDCDYVDLFFFTGGTVQIKWSSQHLTDSRIDRSSENLSKASLKEGTTGTGCHGMIGFACKLMSVLNSEPW